MIATSCGIRLRNRTSVLTHTEAKDLTYLDPNDHQVKPARREITVKHLLTHTTGFTYSSYDNPVAIMYRKARLAEGLCQEEETLEENMRKLAKIPLHFSPGDGRRTADNRLIVPSTRGA